MAASMGAVLLASGAKGKRFALPNAEIMLHQVAGGAQGVATDIEINARQIIRIKESLNNIIAKHTGQKIEKITADTDRDFYLTAESAKEYGIIDEVIKAKGWEHKAQSKKRKGASQERGFLLLRGKNNVLW